MSEQTPAVEEILGWTPVYYSGTPMIVGWHAAGDDEDERKGATVDDLADWLADEGWPIIRFEKDGAYVIAGVFDECGMSLGRVFGRWDSLRSNFVTRLAALEAAVRAVHEQEATDAAST